MPVQSTYKSGCGQGFQGILPHQTKNPRSNPASGSHTILKECSVCCNFTDKTVQFTPAILKLTRRHQGGNGGGSSQSGIKQSSSQRTGSHSATQILLLSDILISAYY